MRRCILPLLVVCSMLCVPITARADAPAAEVLFRDGRKLLLEGKLDQACAKLAESEQLDPSPGTLLNLALCHEKKDKLATAWAEYVEAARMADLRDRAEQAKVAKGRAAALAPRLPRLVIHVAEPVDGMKVHRDSELVEKAMLGVAVPVDPATHEIRASAPGRKPWHTTVQTVEGQTVVVEVPQLEKVAVKPAVEPPAPKPPPVKHTAPAPPVVAKPRRAVPRKSTVLPWIVAGVSVATLGAGAYFGVVSLGSYNDANKLCPAHTGCSSTAMHERSKAETEAWVADIAIPVGVVGIGVASYLLLSRPGEPRRDVGVDLSAGPHGAMLHVTRAF